MCSTNSLGPENGDLPFLRQHSSFFLPFPQQIHKTVKTWTIAMQVSNTHLIWSSWHQQAKGNHYLSEENKI